MGAQYVAGEYGKTLVLNAGVDISPGAGATALSVVIRRPDGSTVTSPATPTVGTTDLTVDGITYAANRHALYVTQDGDIPANIDGYYSIQLSVEFGATSRRKSITRTLEVLD